MMKRITITLLVAVTVLFAGTCAASVADSIPSRQLQQSSSSKPTASGQQAAAKAATSSKTQASTAKPQSSKPAASPKPPAPVPVPKPKSSPAPAKVQSSASNSNAGAVVQARSAPVEVVIPPLTPVSTDSTSEADIPGLEPSNGDAVRAAIPDFSKAADFATISTPILHAVRPVAKLLNFDQPFWKVTNLDPKVQGTILAPTPEAYAKLLPQLIARGGAGLSSIMQAPSDTPQSLLAALPTTILKQIVLNMQLPKFVSEMSMYDGEELVTKAGEKIKVSRKPDGTYLSCNGMQAKIVQGDWGLGALRVHWVDSFLLPKLLG